jgi:hypothetical protein
LHCVALLPWVLQVRQHECALAFGLAADPPSCCAHTRVRYLLTDDLPHLLRMRDVAPRGCEAAITAYACAERKHVRPVVDGVSAC